MKALPARSRNGASTALQRVVLAAIVAYQRYVSPRKGFVCAYRVHTGCASCSTLGYRAVRRFGVAQGLALLRRRTFKCGVSFRRHEASRVLRPAPAQRGDCDLGCDLPGDGCCDLSGGRGTGGVCDFAHCCDAGSCDWPDRKSKRSRKQKDKEVYIPPRARPGASR